MAWAPEYLQRRRALMRPFMTAEKFDQIITTQWPQNEKRRCADLELPSALGSRHSPPSEKMAGTNLIISSVEKHIDKCGT